VTATTRRSLGLNDNTGSTAASLSGRGTVSAKVKTLSSLKIFRKKYGFNLLVWTTFLVLMENPQEIPFFRCFDQA
jgi:hypothetical protein